MRRLVVLAVLVTLVLSVDGRVISPGGRRSSAILFPGTRTCIAPNGKAGDCISREACTAKGAKAGKSLCGLERGRLVIGLFCCERQMTQTLENTTPAPTPSPGIVGSDILCGSANPTSSGPFQNVVNGIDASVNGWPWAALIGHRQRDGSIQWRCGGSLLDATHIITAAHCAIETVDLADVVVRLGEHDLSRTSDSAHQDRSVKRQVRHPDFRTPSRKNDIAIMQLSAPVQLSNRVLPVCLPKPNARLVGRSGFVIGWGQLEPGTFGPVPDVLQQAVVQVTPTEPCNARYERVAGHSDTFPGGLDEGNLCAVDTLGTEMDSCQGDSGGPLSIENLATGRFELAGVVSIGSGCGNPDRPGIYVRVANYVNWITEELKAV